MKIPYIILLSLLSLTAVAEEYGQCPENHCGLKSALIKKVCDNKKLPVAFLEYQGDFCWCQCSCVAGNTLISVPGDADRAIETIAIGDTVLALNNGQWKPSAVTYSGAGGPKPERPYPYAVFVQLDNGASLVTTSDHAFVLSDKSLKRADRLVPTDILLAKDLQPLRIKALSVGQYFGSLVNITTDAPTNSNSLDGHVISTNGVLSGDFFVQNNLIPQSQLQLEQIGSSLYQSKYKSSEVISAKAMSALVKEGVIDLGEGRKFVPYKEVNTPKDAVSFLPKGQDIPRNDLLQTLDASVPYEIAEYVIWQFKRFYPEINFVIDWTNDVANAYAWQQNGQKYVSITGGLIRNIHIKQEAVGLVLSHEMGHHYGGLPRYTQSGNTWASCEGQSDYWGALVAQRQVWWGAEGLRQTKEGGKQLYNFFAYGLIGGSQIANPIKAASDCSHPPAWCRLETYEAATRLDNKPACAGPTAESLNKP